jgi:uncharacterized protein YebE (UPF0316 family)
MSAQKGKLKKLTIVVVVVPKAIIIDRNYTLAQKRYLACSVSFLELLLSTGSRVRFPSESMMKYSNFNA